MAITSAQGVTMTIDPSGPPLTPGFNAGYWFEVRNAAGATLYTHTIQDPTVREGFGPDASFTNVAVPYCDEKAIDIDAPNDPSAESIVVFGSPYGTNAPAGELARFHLL